MTLLNSIDLLICFSVLVIFFAAIFTSIIGSNGNVINSQLGLWFHFLVAATAFVTCLLSVTRTISLVYPFYEIKKNSYRTDYCNLWVNSYFDSVGAAQSATLWACFSVFWQYYRTRKTRKAFSITFWKCL